MIFWNYKKNWNDLEESISKPIVYIGLPAFTGFKSRNFTQKKIEN